MKPTYSSDRVTLYCARCEDVLPTLTWVDAVVTDPPWGVGIDPRNQSRKRGHRPYDRNTAARDFAPVVGDDRPFDPSPLLAWKQVILWGANNFSDRLPRSSFWLVWDRKTDKGAASDITDCELAWTRGTHYKTVRMLSHMWAGFQRDSQAGERHLHPMEKPVALMRWSIGWLDADCILDPFMGSGTTGVAAVQLGRRFVGIECDENYYKVAERRIRQAEQDARLFEQAPPTPEPLDLFAN